MYALSSVEGQMENEELKSYSNIERYDGGLSAEKNPEHHRKETQNYWSRKHGESRKSSQSRREKLPIEKKGFHCSVWRTPEGEPPESEY